MLQQQEHEGHILLQERQQQVLLQQAKQQQQQRGLCVYGCVSVCMCVYLKAVVEEARKDWHKRMGKFNDRSDTPLLYNFMDTLPSWEYYDIHRQVTRLVSAAVISFLLSYFCCPLLLLHILHVAGICWLAPFCPWVLSPRYPSPCALSTTAMLFTLRFNSSLLRMLFMRYSFLCLNYLFRKAFIEHMMYYLIRTGGDYRFFPEMLPWQWLGDIEDQRYRFLSVVQLYTVALPLQLFYPSPSQSFHCLI